MAGAGDAVLRPTENETGNVEGNGDREREGLGDVGEDERVVSCESGCCRKELLAVCEVSILNPQ